MDSPHINNVNDNSFAGNRLLDNVNSVSGLTTVSGLCAACHRRGVAESSPAANKSVNTHGNTGFTGANHDNGAQSFAYNCDACHEPHGMTNNGRPGGGGTSYNIFMIKANIEVRNFSTGVDIAADNGATTTGPVYFESTPGNYSFDDNTSASSSRLCVTCHQSGSRPGPGTKVEASGSLTITPTIGGLDASAGTSFTHTLTTGRERCVYLGTGRILQLRWRQNTAAVNVTIYGAEIPFFELGRK